MILVDTGPLVAWFDPKDARHGRSVAAMRTFREPLYTTVPVLTEAFHMLQPDSVGSDRLRDFVQQRGASVWFLDQPSLARAFELMERYADHPMDLADASLIVAAETLGTRKVFTIDRQDFAAYRIRKGHRHYSIEMIG